MITSCEEQKSIYYVNGALRSFNSFNFLLFLCETMRSAKSFLQKIKFTLRISNNAIAHNKYVNIFSNPFPFYFFRQLRCCRRQCWHLYIFDLIIWLYLVSNKTVKFKCASMDIALFAVLYKYWLIGCFASTTYKFGGKENYVRK